ncbi:MAG: hypothetical protein WKG07_19330 [Hymenobacter sp.]
MRKTASLARDLRFDTVDVVDIILELERSFQHRHPRRSAPATRWAISCASCATTPRPR